MEQRIILVTGGNRGIGKETCRQLAAMAHRIILGSRDLAKGEAAANELDGDITVVKLEVNSEEDIQAAFKTVESNYGKLDTLINNAGIFTTGTVLDESKENMMKVHENNVIAPMRMVQVFKALLEKSEDPRIVNVSSAMGQIAGQLSDHSAYRLSKFSLNGLTMQQAHALPNMKVNSMHPGWVRTDMGGAEAPLSVEEGADTAVWLATADGIPSGRFFGSRTAKEW